MKVGIINVTGYSGMELARLLHRHPVAQLVSVTGRSAAGQRISEVFPHLAELDLTIEAELGNSLDLVFSALPQVSSADACVPLARAGVRVVDISPDFRLKSAAEYRAWYGAEHPAPDLQESAVYGLAELDRDGVRGASLVANPGCYAEAAILALAPVVKEGLIGPDIVIDAKSGVSGAGRGLSLGTHFSEVNENLFPYQVEGHRHLPEITQELARLRPGYEPRVVFMPHLVPMTRGILNTCYADLVEGAFGSPAQAGQAVAQLYRAFYQGEPFVKVTDEPPQTKQTWGSNNCLIHPTVDVRTGKLVVFSALDNLVKGAAGQAVQNMNLMFGLPETAGLELVAVYP